ncbi:hypothetical protein N0K08_17410 [Acidovorax sp. Be4]|uniref:Uncharacterized protein n=1 Tax=Acidovorax bellezanensis TaxID=2976702 RepID=A0ABT2PPM3_9BURK|nr:hypothetical protein [Acidovorax sp. Be4]MCT9812424.1 hypothetical protein [Acidovorax sp. Be4]
MKVIIQTLKAPWPTGAKVGDVVSFEGEVAPAWAVGKYALAPDGAEADHKYEPASVGTVSVSVSVDSEEVQQAFHQLREEALRRISEADDKTAEVDAQLQASRIENEGLTSRLAEAESLIAGLREKLEAAQSDDAKVKAALAEVEQQAEQEKAAIAAADAKAKAKK